jgi:hypothetical protein
MPADWNDDRWTAVFFVESGARLDWLAAHLGARANLVGTSGRHLVSRPKVAEHLDEGSRCESGLHVDPFGVTAPNAYDKRTPGRAGHGPAWDE